MEQPQEITFPIVLRLWWTYWWRATVIGILLGGLLGGVAGFIMALLGWVEHVQTVASILGFAVSIPVTFWALYAMLTSTYRKFEISIRPREESL